MKELIYRRTEGGYAVARCADGVSDAVRAKALNRAGVAVDVKDDFCYRQFRLDDGRIGLGASYLDVDGSRKSVMMHLLLTADARETEALFRGYPAEADFFGDFSRRYNELGKLEKMPDEREISVAAFSGGGGAEAAFALLRERFGTPEALAPVLEALLDVASNNPRMLVLFGPAEEPAAMARRGKHIIEALLSCLPTVAAMHIGYVCPTRSDEGNALLGIRYGARREISPAVRPFAYVCDLENLRLAAPGRANRAAAAYAAKVAGLVFQGDAGAVRSLHERNAELNDEELYDAADVPANLALRDRFLNGPEQISEEDCRAWLDWHHAAVAAGDDPQGSIARSKFWPAVDAWLVGDMLERIYARASNWRDGDPIYSRARVNEIFQDGQKLFALGRPEAAAYQAFFARRIEANALLDDANRGLAERELVRSFVEKLEHPGDGDLAGRCLYWAAIEGWIRARWNDGSLIRDRSVRGAVENLYALDASAGEKYVAAFADLCRKSGASLLQLVRTEFGKAVYRRLREEDSALVADFAARELSGQDPFADPAALDRYMQYRQLLWNDSLLRPAYLRLCDDSLRKWILRQQARDVEHLFDELEDAEGGAIALYRRLNPEGDARGAIEQRLFELVRDEGVYPFYPQKPELAQKVALLLDRRQLNSAWSKRLDVLKSVCALRPGELEEDAFERLMEEGFGAHGDPGLSRRVQELFWDAIRESFEENAGNMKAILMALTLRNSRNGAFRPAGVLEDLEKLQIPEKKLNAFCRRREELDARMGLGYLARVMRTASDGRREDSARDAWVNYPGEAVELPPAGLFAGIPMGVAVASALAFAGGFAASAIGLLRSIGLM